MTDLTVRLAAGYHTLIARLRERQEGATAAEYALLIALIAVAIIAAVTALGTQISGVFQNVSDTIEPAT